MPKTKNIKGVSQGDLLRFGFRHVSKNLAETKFKIAEYLFVNRKTRAVLSTGLLKYLSQVRVSIMLIQHSALKAFSKAYRYGVEVHWWDYRNSTKLVNGGAYFDFKTSRQATARMRAIEKQLKSAKTYAGLQSVLKRIKKQRRR